jgi:A/G-specific adenine glycosylase
MAQRIVREARAFPRILCDMPRTASSPSLPSAKLAGDLRRRLLRWYRAGHRPLPWRSSRDAYRVWVSEAMLQQTRVETVLGYWERFVAQFPTLADLAAAEEDEVLALWSGLGYYSRARRLREAAQAIVELHAGEFPRTRAAARALPGVGPYTAGAVLSIAYDLPESLVDGNVARVFARLFALDAEPSSSRAQRELWDIADELVPRRSGAGDWNQALMELGATVCTSRSPKCSRCPLASPCRALAEDRVAELPRAKPKPQTLEVALEIACVVRAGAVLLEQRPPEGRMAGLWEPPTRELENEAGERSGLFPAHFLEPDALHMRESTAGLRHSITKYRIRADVRSAELVGEAAADWRWFSREELAGLGLTGMAKKVLGL